MAGAPKGNQNRRKPKLIEACLRREATQDPEKILQMVNKIYAMAAAGDMTAATFIRDTLDGKPHQSVDVEHDIGENAIAVMNKEELSAAVTARLAPFLPRPTVPDVGADRGDGTGSDPRTH